jgi:PEP-CTERM motif
VTSILFHVIRIPPSPRGHFAKWIVTEAIAEEASYLQWENLFIPEMLYVPRKLLQTKGAKPPRARPSDCSLQYSQPYKGTLSMTRPLVSVFSPLHFILAVAVLLLAVALPARANEVAVDVSTTQDAVLYEAAGSGNLLITNILIDGRIFAIATKDLQIDSGDATKPRTAVPEPGTLTLLGVGILAFGTFLRRRQAR